MPAAARIHTAVAVAVLLALPLGGPLSAQRISGRAVDAEDDTPVPTALVVLTDASGEEVMATIADSLGRFMVEAPEGGTYHLVAERIGYRRTETPPLALPDTGTYGVDVVLDREPVAVDGVRVDVRAVRDRLERRRMAYAETRSAAFDRDDFAHIVPTNVVASLASRTGAPTAPCFQDAGVVRACFEYRNALVPICVYLDEAPLVGGIEAVSLYVDLLERIEVYPGAGWIRLYSRSFMRRVKEGREEITPFAGPGPRCLP